MFLKLLCSLLVLAGSNLAFAANLEIETPWNVRVEREMQARAYFTNDQGQRLDVTAQADFDTSENYPEYAPGRFFVRLPTFGYGTTHSFTVSVRYTTEDGQTFSAQTRVSADLTPDYIVINGPSYVSSRSSAMFRATGYYSGRSADLTNRGSWYANYGNMSGSGFYWAPAVIPGRGVVYDYIRFNFALRTANFTVYVQ